METTGIIAIVAIMGLLILFSVLGNICIISSIMRKKPEDRTFMMRTKISMACNDLALSILYLVFVVQYSIQGQETAMTVGLFEGFLHFFNCSSIYNACLMCLLHYFAILYPHSFTDVTRKRQYCCIANAWSFGLILLIYYPLMYMNSVPMYCWMLLAAYVYIVPFVFTFSFTIVVIYVFYNSAERYDESCWSDRQAQRWSILETSLVVLGHVATFSPYIVMQFLSWSMDTEDWINFALVTTLLVYLKTPVNTVIYAAFNPTLRDFIQNPCSCMIMI